MAEENYEYETDTEETYEYVDEKEPVRKRKYVPSTFFIILLIIIGLLVIYCKTILPLHLYDKAKRDYEKGNYVQANKIFNVFALINPFDEEVIKYQVMTIRKLPTSYTNQKKLYEIAQYDEDGEGEQLARETVDELRREILTEAGDNYIDNVLFNNRVIRWNLTYKPISFFIESHDKVPEYYRQKVYEAFSEWSTATEDLLTFKEVSSRDASDIVVILSNYIPESLKQYFYQYQVGNTAPVLKEDNLSQMIIHVKNRNDLGDFHNENEFANIIKHEIGHALGIWGHSRRPSDVMYYRADNILQDTQEKYLSDRDINTVKLLYKLYPDTTNVAYPPDEQDRLIYHYIVTKSPKHSSEAEIKLIMEQLNENRNDISKWVELAIEYAINGRYEQSNTILFKALPLIHRDVNNMHVIYYNIAANYYYLHQYRDAENYINRAKRLRNDYDTKVLNSFINYKLGRYDDAEREMNELFIQKPADLEVAIKLADLYRKTGKMDKAKDVLVRLCKYNPEAQFDRRVLKYKVGKIYWGLASGV